MTKFIETIYLCGLKEWRANLLRAIRECVSTESIQSRIDQLEDTMRKVDANIDKEEKRLNNLLYG
ncbi:MAG: hypothetical protein V3W20_05615 [Candidatus Neomarinimicrobiota bacterium]